MRFYADVAPQKVAEAERRWCARGPNNPMKRINLPSERHLYHLHRLFSAHFPKIALRGVTPKVVFPAERWCVRSFRNCMKRIEFSGRYHLYHLLHLFSLRLRKIAQCGPKPNRTTPSRHFARIVRRKVAKVVNFGKTMKKMCFSAPPFPPPFCCLGQR